MVVKKSLETMPCQLAKISSGEGMLEAFALERNRHVRCGFWVDKSCDISGNHLARF